MKNATRIYILFLLILIPFFVSSQEMQITKETRFMMDTYVSIFTLDSKATTKDAVDAAFEKMEIIDEKFNCLNPKSPIYKFNVSGSPIDDKEIVELVKFALDYCKKSNGYFDITIAPLTELWGFYNNMTPRLPSESEIKECLKKINYKKIVINNGIIEKLARDIMIDLGGIAKGYSVNESVKVLKKHGVKNALVDAGGDVYALGKKFKDLWKVGIKNPRDDGIIGFLEVENKSVVGSGDYERFFIDGNIRYHHIFDPKTGYPASELMSVTVLHENAVLADLLSTTLFVMGTKTGLNFIETIEGADAILIRKNGEKLFSERLKKILKLIPN